MINRCRCGSDNMVIFLNAFTVKCRDCKQEKGYNEWNDYNPNDKYIGFNEDELRTIVGAITNQVDLIDYWVMNNTYVHNKGLVDEKLNYKDSLLGVLNKIKKEHNKYD